PAAPDAVTARLTSAGVILTTTSLRWRPARQITPRACPIRIAARGAARAVKTSSTTTRSGANAARTPWMASKSRSSRSSSGSAGRVRRTPTPRTAAPSRPSARTAYPVSARPGSKPTARSPGDSSAGGLVIRPSCGPERFQHLVRDVEVRVYLLDVVQLLQPLDEPEHLLGFLALQADGGLRDVRHLGGLDRHAALLEDPAHGLQLGGLGGDLEDRIGPAHVARPALERESEQLVLVDARRLHHDQPLPLEHPGDRADLGHVPAVLREAVPDLGRGPVLVVGQHLHQQGDAAGRVALVHHLFVRLAGQLAGALLDRPLEGVGGHVDRLRLLHGRLQAHVALRVAAAHPRGGGDLPDQLREELPALLVVLRLLTLDLRPFRMA